MNTFVYDEETRINKILIRDINMKIDGHGLIDSNGSKFLRIVALFNEL